MPLYKKRHANLETQAIVEENSVRPKQSAPSDLEANTEHVVVAPLTDSAGIHLQETVSHALEPPSWWKQPSPRLQTTDTLEHVQSVISRNFGAGVDMDRYLSPARTAFDDFTDTDREFYKTKGFKVTKIPASWKKWTAMNTSQKGRFINQLYALSEAHASQVEHGVASAFTIVAKELHEEVGKNRTMHEFARVIHIMSDSDNMASTKALHYINFTMFLFLANYLHLHSQP
jgi:hypothetical protein